MNGNRGFTLIELVVVIVILGLLAATAIPKFIDLTTDAKSAAIRGVAGGLASASAVNYSARKVNNTYGVSIANCTAVSGAMQAYNASDFSITPAAIGVNAVVNCTVNGQNGTQYSGLSASFQAIGIG
jgi:MSHA pilin protein MshA